MIEQVNGLYYPHERVGMLLERMMKQQVRKLAQNLCSSQCLKIQCKMFTTHRRM